jgi:alpha-D-ribose 1-methylphosphonate 5-triphosphate synthase subunit PhnI
MYVAVKGGEKAIAAAHELLAEARRGDPKVAEIGLDQIKEQLALAVARVMSEASLYDAELAALAVKQARGDLIEAIFLARAYRTTLPRFGESLPLETSRMRIWRRISACFKDMPGGQVLGPTFDYTHRLLGEMGEVVTSPRMRGEFDGDRGWPEGEGLGEFDPASAPAHPAAHQPSPPASNLEPPPAFSKPGVGPPLPASGERNRRAPASETDSASPGDCGPATFPRIAELLGAQALIEEDPPEPREPPGDITREPLEFPAGRDLRLQALARGDEGFLLGLAYSTQRGFGRTHPFAGEIRYGEVEIEFDAPELGFAVPLGRVAVTECDMVNQFRGSADAPPQFTRGYGLVFGQSERKAMSMALVDRALRAREFGEEVKAPAQDEEFVLSHSDNVQATGFVEHLKLPHYVDFQAELVLLRKLRREWEGRRSAAGADEPAHREAAE